MSKDKMISLRVSEPWLNAVDEAAKRMSGNIGPRYSRSTIVQMAVYEWMQRQDGAADLVEMIEADALD